MGQKWKSLLKFLLKAGITALAFWWISGKISWSDTITVLRTAHLPWLIPAVLLFNASKVMSAFRLELFWGATGVRLSRLKNLALYYVGMFYNLFLPGGIGGDGYKVWLLNKTSGVKTVRLAQAVIIDRITGVLPLIILATIFLYFVNVTGGIAIWLKVTIVAASILIYICSYLVIAAFFKPFKRIFHYAAIQGAGVQLLQALSALCIILALGTETNKLAYLLLFLGSSIIAVLPLTIGGVGAREWAMVTGCLWFSLNREAAVALGLVFFLITAVSSLPGGFIPALWYKTADNQRENRLEASTQQDRL